MKLIAFLGGGEEKRHCLVVSAAKGKELDSRHLNPLLVSCAAFAFIE